MKVKKNAWHLRTGRRGGGRNPSRGPLHRGTPELHRTRKGPSTMRFVPPKQRRLEEIDLGNQAREAFAYSIGARPPEPHPLVTWDD